MNRWSLCSLPSDLLGYHTAWTVPAPAPSSLPGLEQPEVCSVRYRFLLLTGLRDFLLYSLFTFPPAIWYSAVICVIKHVLLISPLLGSKPIIRCLFLMLLSECQLNTFSYHFDSQYRHSVVGNVRNPRCHFSPSYFVFQAGWSMRTSKVLLRSIKLVILCLSKALLHCLWPPVLLY